MHTGHKSIAHRLLAVGRMRREQSPFDGIKIGVERGEKKFDFFLLRHQFRGPTPPCKA